MTKSNPDSGIEPSCLVAKEKIEGMYYAVQHLEELVNALNELIRVLPEIGEPMTGHKKSALSGIAGSMFDIYVRLDIDLEDIDFGPDDAAKLN